MAAYWLVMNHVGSFYCNSKSAQWTRYESLGLRFSNEIAARLFIENRFTRLEINALTIQPTRETEHTDHAERALGVE